MTAIISDRGAYSGVVLINFSVSNAVPNRRAALNRVNKIITFNRRQSIGANALKLSTLVTKILKLPFLSLSKSLLLDIVKAFWSVSGRVTAAPAAKHVFDPLCYQMLLSHFKPPATESATRLS